MLVSKTLKAKTATALALLLGTATVAPIISANTVLAQSYPTNRESRYQANLGIGTRIPVDFEQAERILVAPDETVSLTLTASQDIRDNNGRIIIPAGSEIVGQLEPVARGTQFVARELIVNGERYTFSADSAVVTRTEEITKGANTGTILGGTVAGAGAAAIIAGVTGDKRIDALEVLAGAAIGTLAGWGLPASGTVGGGSQEVLAVYPDRDLTLTLRSPFARSTTQFNTQPVNNRRYDDFGRNWFY